MVSKDLHRKQGPMEVVSPGLQSTNNGEEFPVIDVIVLFCRREQLGKIGAGMPVTVGVCLEEDGGGGIFGGVCCNSKGSGEVQEMEDRLQQEKGLEGVKQCLACRRPVPRKVLFGGVNKGSSDIGVVEDKTSIKVHEAKEGSHVFEFLRSGPTCNPIQFDRVHGKLSGFDNHTKVFHFGGGEAAFLKFEVEVQLGHSLKDVSGVFSVGFFVRGEDEKVVHINDEPSFGDHVLEGVVHELLERSRGVGKPKEHDGRFK